MSRIEIEFIKEYLMNGVRYKPGNKARMRIEKAQELIKKKIIKEYTGEWPPKTKTKINLKDLK
jgi:hypothetical protein